VRPLVVFLSLVIPLVFVVAAPLDSYADETLDRLRPLPESEWSPEVVRLLRGTHDRVATLEGGGSASRDDDGSDDTLAILRTMAHHPKLLGPFLGFATALAQEGVLSRRDSELLALRAAWNCASEFEWGHHVLYARAAGLSQAEIDRIPDGPGAEGWSPADRDLLEAADRLHARQQIEDALWRRLAARYSEAQLVEIPFVVGQYTMLSMVANMTGVALEEGYPRLPERTGRGR
jgi:alkylhydroperoxidase family enzyme